MSTTAGRGASARWIRAVLGAAGVAALGYGLAGLLGDPYVHRPLAVAGWALGAVVLHDGLWVPLLLLGGRLTGRLPGRARGPVRAGLLVAAALTAVAAPVLLRRTQHRGNVSLLPLDYPGGWLLCLGAVAAVTGATLLLRGVRRRVSPRRGGAPPFAAARRSGPRTPGSRGPGRGSG